MRRDLSHEFDQPQDSWILPFDRFHVSAFRGQKWRMQIGVRVGQTSVLGRTLHVKLVVLRERYVVGLSKTPKIIIWVQNRLGFCTRNGHDFLDLPRNGRNNTR